MIFNRLRHRHRGSAAGSRQQVELPAVPPGLVGGHCIGVDPYYLTHKAQAVGYHPEMILAGRRIEATAWASTSPQRVSAADDRASGIQVATRGCWCSDSPSRRTARTLRNTRVVDIVRELLGLRCARSTSTIRGSTATSPSTQYGFEPIRAPGSRRSTMPIVLAVAHREFRRTGCREGPQAFGKRSRVHLRHQARVRRATQVDGRL